MMADLIPPEQRPDAYALLRMSNNLGISIGPAIGGFVAATSYNFAFLGAALGMSSYAVLIAIFARETLPGRAAGAGAVAPPAAVRPPPARRYSAARSPFGGYLKIFSDRPFVYFIVAFTLNQVCAALIWVLLGVHAKTNFGVTENLYGFIPMTNALMVVLLQALVTRQTKNRNPLPVLALGSLFYAVAVTSVAFGRGFWGFWLQHGDHDHGRANADAHRHHLRRQPGPGRHARALHVHLRPHLGRGAGHRPGDGRLPGRQLSARPRPGWAAAWPGYWR